MSEAAEHAGRSALTDLAQGKIDAAEARVRTTRAFYQCAVAAYLAARTEHERSVLGDAMYYAQMATIEARFNPEGCAHFRALAEVKLTVQPPLSGAVTKSARAKSTRSRAGNTLRAVDQPRDAEARDELALRRAA